MPRVAILVEKMFEDLELHYPRLRLAEAGHAVDVIGPKRGETYVGKHGLPQKAEKAASDVRAGDYDLIVIPGGYSPDHMRRDEGIVAFVTDAAKRKIPMAAICHGPWMLCSTDALKGRRCTSFYSVADDVRNAGATWVDEACVVDGGVISSRVPADLPAFCRAILQALAGEAATGDKGEPIAPQWVRDRAG